MFGKAFLLGAIHHLFLHQKPCILHVLASNFKGETSETYQRHVLSQDALRLAGKSLEDLPEGWGVPDDWGRSEFTEPTKILW